MGIVEEVRVENLEELNKQLFFLNEKNCGKYVFRGHSDAKYKLLPNILRDINCKENNLQLFRKEGKLLIEFFRECNNQGLKVPNIKRFRDYYMTDDFDLSFFMGEKKYYWLDDCMSELGALGQHYGLKTRFLDWTQDIRVALYFSCNDPNNNPSEEASIWAINADFIQKFKSTQIEYIMFNATVQSKLKENVVEYESIYESYDDSIPLKFWVPAYSDNPNVNAQKGVLSSWQYNTIEEVGRKGEKIFTDKIKFNEAAYEAVKNFFTGNVDVRPLDVMLNEYMSLEKNKSIYEKYLRKNDAELLYNIIFPRKIFNDIKKKLQIDGYTTAKMFPGYKGVVDYLKEPKIASDSM